MSEEFTEVRILDNFYQTSSFSPMPVVLVSTLAESGQTNLDPYSLCFPYIIKGGRVHDMMLISRDLSNTARSIIRMKVCALNFILDKKSIKPDYVKTHYNLRNAYHKKGELGIFIEKYYGTEECKEEKEAEQKEGGYSFPIKA